MEMTDTELRLMATLAIIGLSKSANGGNKTPAAIGMPRKLKAKAKKPTGTK